MATTLWMININFNSAMKKADELDSIASELKTLAGSRFDESLKNLASNWSSDHSLEYLSKASRLEAQIIQSAKQLSDIADSIRSCARRTRSAELRALELAQLREYN